MALLRGEDKNPQATGTINLVLTSGISGWSDSWNIDIVRDRYRLSIGGEQADYEPKNVQSLYHLRMWTNGWWSVEYRSSVYASMTASEEANKLRLSSSGGFYTGQKYYPDGIMTVTDTANAANVWNPHNMRFHDGEDIQFNKKERLSKV